MSRTPNQTSIANQATIEKRAKKPTNLAHVM